ncbi:Bro-N domain-containing protein [Patescibacteria group bacterium]|nr:Bro-N domain-containing protein [Patescibacteria group bacterium]MBU4347758.1 Bro-N domain-containing protein [Patescibacteria group bacterium]
MAIFEGQKIRRIWDEEKELWYFSVVDVIAVLTDQSEHKRAQSYWTTMKNRLKEEGSEVVTKCDQLKMQATDGKYYLTDAADTEAIFRLIQSIPSPKAEPFKLWLARVGYERVEETEDPEKAIQRAMATYLKKGYSKEWVNLRLKSIEIRKDLTNEWDERGVKTGNEFAILTDDITFAWAGLKIKDYKKHKDLKKENFQARRRKLLNK